MKKERKEALVGCFPPVSAAQHQQMKGKGAANFIVFLTWGRELFARGFHRYSNGELVERQRYVFAKDGAVRYGSETGTRWTVRSEFREPVFCSHSYGYTFNNMYAVINIKAIDKSDMRYSQYQKYTGSLLISYLHLYCKHPNLEYLMKQGFELIKEYCTGYWGGACKLQLSSLINWKTNNMLNMLGINREEFKVLRESPHVYERYIGWRDEFPKMKPADLMHLAEVFGSEHGTLARFVECTKLTPQRIARYLSENQVCTMDYSDYLQQCVKLNYDLHDTAISMPHGFSAMHERLSAIIQYQHNERVKQEFMAHMADRSVLEFALEDLMIIQPKRIEDIAAEGAALNHCVGGYAERHAAGKLHILFIRTADKPDVPYYTMEVSTAGEIVQVRGSHNRAPGKAVSRLVEAYRAYLAKIFKKERKTA